METQELIERLVTASERIHTISNYQSLCKLAAEALHKLQPHTDELHTYGFTQTDLAHMVALKTDMPYSKDEFTFAKSLEVIKLNELAFSTLNTLGYSIVPAEPNKAMCKAIDGPFQPPAMVWKLMREAGEIK